jgi:hypothetical protein
VSRRGRRSTLVPGAGAVDTHGEIIIGVAVLVGTGVVVGGDVPVATHLVVDVVAVLGSITANASTDAEFSVRDERCPLVVLNTRAEGVTVEKSTSRVATTVSTTVIEFSSRVTLLDVQLGEVTDTSNLNVVRSLDEVNTLEGSVGDSTSTAARLGAPCNSLMLSIADSAVGVRRCPETEVLSGVDPSSLAVGRLGRGSSASVGSVLVVLGGGGKLGRKITNVPDLVGVGGAIAAPNLRASARSSIGFGQVKALAVVNPSDRVIPDGVVPVLVGVRSIARPDLEQSTIDIGTVDNVEAFVPIDFDGAVGESPLLVVGSSAGLDRNGSTVSVGCNSQALVSGQGRLDQERANERWRLSRDCTDSGSDEDNCGSSAYHCKGM